MNALMAALALTGAAVLVAAAVWFLVILVQAARAAVRELDALSPGRPPSPTSRVAGRETIVHRVGKD